MKNIKYVPGIEFVTHHDAKAKVVKDAKKANAVLQKVLEDNHFTIKIYLAAGGSLPTKAEKLTTKTDNQPEKTWKRTR